jgi:hypothetical protein
LSSHAHAKTPPTILQRLPILRLITCFRGFFVDLRAGVGEEAGDR